MKIATPIDLKTGTRYGEKYLNNGQRLPFKRASYINFLVTTHNNTRIGFWVDFFNVLINLGCNMLNGWYSNIRDI